MRIANTSALPDGVVRAVVRFAARELEVADYVSDVKVTACAGSFPFQGRCWGRRVLARIGPASAFPMHREPYRERAPAYDLLDPVEALAALIGHEFGHSRQFRAQAQRNSEVDAERYALSVLTRFREVRAEVLGPAEARQAAVAAAGAARAAARPPAPLRRIADLEAKVAAWQTKAKRASTWLKKYERKLARAQRAAEKTKPQGEL